MTRRATKMRSRKARKQTWRIWWAVGLGAMVAIAVIFTLANTGSETPGDPAPEIALPNFEGETVRVSDFNGQPLVVNYWASWCLPCLAEMPGFEQVHQSTKDEVGFLGINLADNPASALAVIDDTGITYPVAIDRDGASYEAFGGFAMPTTVFIDAEGRVVEVFSGDLTATELADKLAEHFGV